jgi:hypothetical protein
VDTIVHILINLIVKRSEVTILPLATQSFPVSCVICGLLVTLFVGGRSRCAAPSPGVPAGGARPPAGCMFRVCSGPAPAVSYHAKRGHVCVAPVLVPLYLIGAPAPATMASK